MNQSNSESAVLHLQLVCYMAPQPMACAKPAYLQTLGDSLLNKFTQQLPKIEPQMTHVSSLIRNYIDYINEIPDIGRELFVGFIGR